MVDDTTAENWEDPISYGRGKWTAGVDKDGIPKPDGRKKRTNEINGDLSRRMECALETTRTSRDRAVRDTITNDIRAALLDSESTILEYDRRRYLQYEERLEYMRRNNLGMLDQYMSWSNMA